MRYGLRGFGDGTVGSATNPATYTDGSGNCLTPGYINAGMFSTQCQPFSPSDALSGALLWALPSGWGPMFSRKDPYQIAGFLAVPVLIWLFFRGGR